MQEKAITVIIDEQGNSTLDPEGFAGHSCEKLFDDFHGGDMVKVERKKPAFYSGHVVEREKGQH